MMTSTKNSEFVDIEAEPRKIIPSEPEDESEDTEQDESEESVVVDYFGREKDLTQPMIVEQPRTPVLKQHDKSKKTVKFTKTERARTVRQPAVLPQQDILYRRGKGRVQTIRDPRFPSLPLHEEMFPQSHAGGWAEESDTDADTDVFREVRKMKMDPTFQIYLIVGIIVLVLSVVGSVKFYEFIYGKPKIPENTFDWMKKDDEEL
jgi:hypothetical protein